MSKIGAVSVKKVVVEIPVQNTERAKGFYEDVFDLKESWYMEGSDFCELFLPGDRTTLGLVAARGDARAVRREAQLWFEVGPADLQVLREHFQDRGIEATEIVDQPGEVSYFRIEDSEGNSISIGGDPRVDM